MAHNYERYDSVSSSAGLEPEGGRNDEDILSTSNVWFDTDANASYTNYLAASFRSETALEEAVGDPRQETSFSASDRPADIVIASTLGFKSVKR